MAREWQNGCVGCGVGCGVGGCGGGGGWDAENLFF